ncbi:MAG TPA: hypothetical protein VHB21_14175, partial [Minicystis sp.]|nr:hypothetical protein [Minicystis sp.]
MTSGRAALAIASALGAAACAPARPPPSPPSSHAPPAPDRDAYALVEAPSDPGPLPAVPPLPPRRTGHDIEVVQPDAEARTTARVIDGPTLGHDPQVAVGERFVVVYDAHFYAVLDKATGRLVDARPGDESAPRGDFGTLFSPVWAPRDRLGRPNPHDVNLKLDLDHEDARVCDPEHPTESVACVQEFYDTRIVYDAARKRFWIESAARNHLWRCGPKTACPDARHSPTHARRFIAVAVSRTDDPRDGFHRYVLVDEYADWPKIGVHGRYLVLSHRMSPNLYVFDANVLAAGNPSRGPVRLAKLDVRDYGVRYFAPVAHRGPPSDVTLVLGGTGSERVRPIALVDAGAGAAPRVVAGDWVEASRRVPPLDNPAVFRADLVTATWDECAGGEHAPCDGLKQVHVLRFPARYEAASGRLVASVDR